ncbi:hypothetical protein TUBRATIS_009520 [Tubulinosema ratisbonensis]|uniref:Transmembrane protein n=1 Tax=Tubulinosema ratisbonensis TaxID=291195 RepID=A0A437AN61_9MICR|nr:hypothetical protein TUBRATIS_009520 [Tubulinosema ratisbonensis]
MLNYEHTNKNLSLSELPRIMDSQQSYPERILIKIKEYLDYFVECLVSIYFGFFVSKALTKQNNLLPIFLVLLSLTLKILKNQSKYFHSNLRKTINLSINLLYLLSNLVFLLENLIFYKRILGLIFSNEVNNKINQTYDKLSQIIFCMIYGIIITFCLLMLVFYNLIRIFEYMRRGGLFFVLWIFWLTVNEFVDVLLTNFYDSYSRYLFCLIGCYVVFESKKFYRNLLYNTNPKSFFQILSQILKLIFVLFVLWRMRLEKLGYFLEGNINFKDYIFDINFYYKRDNVSEEGLIN